MFTILSDFLPYFSQELLDSAWFLLAGRLGDCGFHLLGAKKQKNTLEQVKTQQYLEHCLSSPLIGYSDKPSAC